MTKFAVLWLPSSQQCLAPAKQFLGAGASDPPPKPRFSVEDFDASQAAEAALSPEVVIARCMPIRLISPFIPEPPAGDDVWGIEAVGADRSPFDGAGCRVAVLDTGIAPAHPAFAGLKIDQKDFTGEGEGDANGHGTHCAGTIFGRDVQGKRIGVAPGVAHVLIGKVLDSAGGGTSLAIYEALIWAVLQRADIISMSVGLDFPGYVAKEVEDGWPVELATSEALVAYSENLKLFEVMKSHAELKIFGNSALIVAAAGNESRRNLRPDFRIAPSLPASAFDLAVGAVGRSDSGYCVADFSNAPPTVVAPGVNIVSAALGGGLTTMSGTSMACPHVAGVAALWANKLRNEGERVSAEILLSYISLNTRRDCIAGFSNDEVGRGLVSAPM